MSDGIVCVKQCTRMGIRKANTYIVNIIFTGGELLGQHAEHSALHPPLGAGVFPLADMSPGGARVNQATCCPGYRTRATIERM